MIERQPAPIRVILRTLVTWWDAWLNLAAINVLWGLCWLTIILGPPATFGMYYAANELVHGRSVGLQDFIDGGRRYFLKSWLWALSTFAVIFLGWNGLRFYGQISSDFGTILQGLIIAVLIGWLTIQFYALPYFMEQTDKRLRLALRNGLFTALASPIYTVIVVGTAFIVAGISVLFGAPLFLFGPSLIAVLGTHAVFERLERFGIRKA